ncbi:NADH:ubiquinone reductase (H(+)-translocating) [Handroanthus impetiginosus]|uniref:NADH:ubiquinone reductase (H(+)-translocating) n=1 Tax=Handroanthus impetiginosus TaxID=429701 RepID=A0A2G9FVH3_9LAMI|nr:NADH:ubiquinone reductase (H(+)-translocating) [Handroanthus impetiginosus]
MPEENEMITALAQNTDAVVEYINIPTIIENIVSRNAILLPLYGFHLWLPKAHVQASVSGSIILAGVLLKLGGYGVVRFLFLLDKINICDYFIDFFLYLSVYGGLLVRFFCLRQRDLKVLIAYSSVVHISIMFFGLLGFSFFGYYGAIFIILSHGFISPIMFYFLTFIYNINHSRSLLILKGLVIVSPLYCLY